MHKGDITNIHFRDHTLDYVICNHVMEHIVDEKKAVFEIKRVLKTKGKWIFSFPICSDMKTYDDESIISAEDRLKEYGQDDHVRLYGTDYIERFDSYELKLRIFSPESEMDNELIKRYGLIKNDVTIIAEKDM